jgi:Ser/Thr protein kinase RdoA (MazF antagonist)
VQPFVALSEPEQAARLELLARAALTAYNLRSVKIIPLRRRNNAVFKVEVEASPRRADTYVLRIHRSGYRSIAETRSELQYLQALKQEAGLAVPEPIPTRNGGLVVSAWIEGMDAPRHCSLLAWLDGHPRYPWAADGLGPKSAYRLGELLGHMHAFARCFRPPQDFHLPHWDAEGLLTEASPYQPGPLEANFSPADRAVFAIIEQRTRAAFAVLGQGPEQFGIIHADFILGNCLFDRRKAQVLDFDDCGWGYFLYDLCPLLGNLKAPDDYPALRRAFLAGYRSIRPIPTAHEVFIDLFIAVRHTTCCLWASGCQRTQGMADAAKAIAYRLGEIRKYLAAYP